MADQPLADPTDSNTTAGHIGESSHLPAQHAVVETITEAEAGGAAAAVVVEVSNGEGSADDRCARAKQLLKDGDFLGAGQLLRSAAGEGSGEACSIIAGILEQQQQHPAAAALVKVRQGQGQDSGSGLGSGLGPGSGLVGCLCICA